jgi:hypothetical protein
VSDQQLWLFPQPKPLRERLGDAFFRQIPPVPGVYLMCDGQERVLYVGQSGNLRQRLNSYKNIRPETHARKLVRLACHTEKIVWETCDSPEAARLRENLLLRHHRPKFNRMNVRPEAYGYIGFRASATQLELWLTNDMGSAAELFGAFKGQRRSAYGALYRLLHQVLLGPEVALSDLGRALRLAGRAAVPLPNTGGPSREGDWAAATRRYLSGESNELVEALRAALPPDPSLPLFWHQVQALDFETLAEFYERGPQRNSRLRAAFNISARPIGPAELDDLLVRFREK